MLQGLLVPLKWHSLGPLLSSVLTFSGCSRACSSMTISSIFQDLKEVGVKLTPMSAAQIHAKTRATVWTGSTVTGKECYP